MIPSTLIGLLIAALQEGFAQPVRRHRQLRHAHARGVPYRIENGRRRGNQRRLAHPFGAIRAQRFGIFDQMRGDGWHIADGGNQIIMKVVGTARDILFHQRHAQALRDAAVNLAFNLGGIDRATDIVRRVHVQDPGGAQRLIDFDLGDLRREAIGGVGCALAIGIERRGRRIEVAFADGDIAVCIGRRR